MRRAAALALAALALAAPAGATPPNVVTTAEYAEPTARYPHGVLGDDLEWGALRLTVDACHGCARRDIRTLTIRLPESRVFEDTAPRVVDLDDDDVPEVVVVESDAALGARLAVYDDSGLVAATPFIGTRFRWLAPAGAADLDGDGRIEIAYVDRPHLARTLRIWRYEDRALTEVASLPGVTNHRIGEIDIAGGLRDCGAGPEVIVADAAWTQVLAVTLSQGRLSARPLGPHRGRDSFAEALDCRDPR